MSNGAKWRGIIITFHEHLQAAEQVIWAYGFRFSPEVFWYPISPKQIKIKTKIIGYQKTSAETLKP